MKCPICNNKAIVKLRAPGQSSNSLFLRMFVDELSHDWEFDCPRCNIHKKGNFLSFERVVGLFLIVCVIPISFFLFAVMIEWGLLKTKLTIILFFICAVVAYLALFYTVATWFLEARVRRYIKSGKT